VSIVGVARGTSAMTSGSDGAHPVDSASGPFGCPRSREKPDSKVQSSNLNSLTPITAEVRNADLEVPKREARATFATTSRLQA
jgi:hypothetical protein